jgi:predicted methyltransferase
MRLTIALAVCSLVLAISTAHAASPSEIAAAVAAPDRTDKERAADAHRKPAEIMAFVGVKAGDVVVDVGPGAGYYTRILGHIVGAKGKVFAVNMSWVAEKFPKGVAGFAAGVGSFKYGNVEAMVQEIEALKFAKPADVVFFSLEYHDQHWQKRDVAKMNKSIHDALKPGGVYVVIDHSAQAGSGTRDCGTLHRIDAEVVKSEIAAAGFAFAGESKVLRNPADPLTESVFGSIRGKTDQFIYKFVKTGS